MLALLGLLTIVVLLAAIMSKRVSPLVALILVPTTAALVSGFGLGARALVVHGEGDLVPERVSRMYADCLPNSLLHVLTGDRAACGHYPLSEQPEQFAEVVGRFLAGRE